MCEEYGLEVPVYTAEREVLAGLTGYALTRGVLCAMRRPGEVSVDTLLSQRQAATREGSARNATGIPLPNLGEQPDSNVQRQAVYGKGRRRIVVLDGVVNSENTGAIFRAAAALGMDAVLLTRTCCDPLNRRACRVSMGTVFQVPWTWIEGGERSEGGGKSYPQVLRELGFKSVAMALTDRSVPIDDPVLREPERLAIIMGTEGDGLSAEVLEACDYVARIPMQHGVDSLNVAAAAAVAFWELG
ncbi:MAG: RNA methyltransferase [Bacteroidales bacterium]|nr:RNA methyltransferase [Bacteroidales bacterium]